MAFVLFTLPPKTWTSPKLITQKPLQICIHSQCILKVKLLASLETEIEPKSALIELLNELKAWYTIPPK